jgi:hypothetical protein
MNNDRQKAPRKWTLFVWPTIAVFVVLKVFITIKTVSSEAELSYIEKEIENLQKVNFALEDDLANASSLTEIENKKEELGFAKPTSVVYLSSEETVAQAH